MLKIFHKELINEWVETGNPASQVAKNKAKIVSFFDNASFHKKEDYLKKMKQKCVIFVYNSFQNTAETITKLN
ncbi:MULTISPECIES: hypothetical protein [unclassified Microcoleus]|uniref:hypothetical protein n=1 Tax=unclassified Microcoleus TaxID=2642155 RepID=UPI002FD0E208